MAKKYKKWAIILDDVSFARIESGEIEIEACFRVDSVSGTLVLSPSAARRLFQKLSGDYRD